MDLNELGELMVWQWHVLTIIQSF